MDDIVGDSLRKVVKGAAIFFIGTVLSLLISFVGRIIIIRYLTPAQFGIISLAGVIFSITGTLTSLGLPEGLTRQASYFLGRGQSEKAKAIFKAGLVLSLIIGLVVAVALFILSNLFAEFFDVPDLSWVLKMYSVSFPFGMLAGVYFSVFRTYERVDIKVIFEDLLPNILKLSLIATVVVLGLSFYWAVIAYVLPAIISGAVFLVYSLKNIDLKTSENYLKYWKPLILFSLPLLIQMILGMVITWTDTIMIGYYLNPTEVGLYNGAQPLAKLMQTFLTAVIFLYFPIASQLYARNQIKEMGRTYAIITKWLMSASLPIFLVLFLFPDVVLWLLYGEKYVPAANVLKILALGFFIHTMLGPNGITLIAAGKPNIPMAASFAAAIVNVIFNFVLIPLLGITGAAVASVLTYVTGNIVVALKLYSDYGIHPFTKNYVKPMLLSTVVAYFIYSLSKNIIQVQGWMLPILFVLFLATYFLSLLLTRSFDREDIMLILSVEQRLGIDLGWVKRVLRKFV